MIIKFKIFQIFHHIKCLTKKNVNTNYKIMYRFKVEMAIRAKEV